MTFADRLLRDLKTSAPKTALLALLACVGLYFWIPPLWRVVTGSGAKADALGTATASAARPNAKSASAATAPSSDSGTPKLGWRDAERLRSSDDLFRSTKRSDIREDAFVFDDDFLPIDVEFAVDPPANAAAVSKDGAQPGGSGDLKLPAKVATPPLTLGSTLVSAGRRAALINGRVYEEGARIAASGQLWTLRNVDSRRVVLDAGGETLELKIDPFAASKVQAAK